MTEAAARWFVDFRKTHAIVRALPDDMLPITFQWFENVMQQAYDAGRAARLTDARLRQMLEDYRDAWSPGARDELFAQYKAEIAANG